MSGDDRNTVSPALTVNCLPDDLELVLEPKGTDAARTCQEAVRRAETPATSFWVEDVEKEDERRTGLGVVFTVKAFREAWVAYAVFDDHRRSNWTPYVFVTRDFGKTWKSLAAPEIDGYCHVIKEDAVSRDLLFLGTEFGLFVSFDGGAKWMKWTHGLPTVPVYDIALQPVENDLVIATHGRAIYVIDDISPLRELSAELVGKKLHLFKTPAATMWQAGRMSAYQSPGDAIFAGENKNTQACISYFLTPVERKDEKPEDGAPAAGPGGAAPFMTAGARTALGQGMVPGGAAGRFGAGLLIDTAGDDRYEAGAAAQGAGHTVRLAAGPPDRQASGAEIEYERGYPVVVNSAAETEFARQVAEELVGPQRVVFPWGPTTGSEDFAYYLQHKPGCFLRLGNGEHSPMVHNAKYDFDDANLTVGAAYWTRLVERFLAREAA